MLWILLVLSAVLLLGPLRRPYLRHAIFTVPATVGAIAGYAAGNFVVGLATTPPLIALLLPWVLAFGLGISLGEFCKAWCDQTFGERNQRRGGNGTGSTGQTTR
jgi:hypothetical protein